MIGPQAKPFNTPLILVTVSNIVLDLSLLVLNQVALLYTNVHQIATFVFYLAIFYPFGTKKLHSTEVYAVEFDVGFGVFPALLYSRRLFPSSILHIDANRTFIELRFKGKKNASSWQGVPHDGSGKTGRSIYHADIARSLTESVILWLLSKGSLSLFLHLSISDATNIASHATKCMQQIKPKHNIYDYCMLFNS